MNLTASSSNVVSLVNAGVMSLEEARKQLGLEPIAGSVLTVNSNANSKYNYWFDQPGWVTNPNISINPIYTVPVPNGVPGTAWQNAPVIYTAPAEAPVPPSFEDLEAMLEAAGLHDVLAKHRKMRAQPEEKEPVEIEVLPLDRKRRIRLA